MQKRGKFTVEYWRDGRLVNYLVKFIPIIDNGISYLLNVIFPTDCKTVWPIELQKEK